MVARGVVLKYLMPLAVRPPMSWLSAAAGYSVNGDACRVGIVHVKQGRVFCGRCGLWHGIEACVMCVVASVVAASNDHRCVNYRHADVHSCICAQYRLISGCHDIARSTNLWSISLNWYDPWTTVICCLKDPESLATECRHAVCHMQITRADDHLHWRSPRRSAARVVRGG